MVLVVVQRSLSSIKNTSTLRKPVFDLKGIIALQEQYRESIVRRLEQKKLDSLEYIIKNRPAELELANKINGLRYERTKLGEVIRKEKTIAIQNKLKEIKEELKSLEKKHTALSDKIHEEAEVLPNLLDPTVPSDPHNQEVISFINCSSEDEATNRYPVNKFDNKDIAEKLKIVDFDVAARISGSSWYYLIGDGALLEQALIQYGLSRARKRGYTLISPPSIVKSEIVNACGFKPRDQNNEQQVYDISNSDLSLTGTAEIPLGAFLSSSTLPASQQFPIKYVGISRSYRAEAGARGRDTKGLYRVHEFTKIELFHFTTRDRSSEELEELRRFQEDIIRDLGLCAKMSNMPTSDLGAPALKKYDCEAWMPGRGSWGELTSCSNCGEYQSRRLSIRVEGNDRKLNYAHTLNGTCLAIPRVIAAILEQFYDPESNSVMIPEPLRPYMDGKVSISVN
ncbi:uncharacterized protein PRCAT00001029001 [Priceomyces carsonii]|uniref:uncharacterized protein n=1 Tax=Priceomyces carsonii TaxID=28549 RepID=UPI002EDAF2A5|nr:unnamed protein product [Priceomyces carsonii]